jgi:hypothetical protein
MSKYAQTNHIHLSSARSPSSRTALTPDKNLKLQPWRKQKELAMIDFVCVAQRALGFRLRRNRSAFTHGDPPSAQILPSNRHQSQLTEHHECVRISLDLQLWTFTKTQW